MKPAPSFLTKLHTTFSHVIQKTRRVHLVLLFVVAILAILHFIFLLNRFSSYFGDTSLLISHVQSIREGSGWAKGYLASNIQALQNSTQNPDYWCQKIIGTAPLQIRGGMSEHPYMYLMALGYLSKFLDIDGIHAYLGAITVAHLAPLIYIFWLGMAFRQKFSTVVVLILSIYTNIIFLNLIWAQPHIEQLVYVFLPPFIFFTFRRFLLGITSNLNYVFIFVSGLLTIGVSERVSLIVGFMMLASCMILLASRNFHAKDLYIVIIASLQVIWFFAWKSFFSDSIYYSGITIQTFMHNLSNLFSTEMRLHTIIFLLVNLTSLIIILQVKVYSLWMLLAFIPNLLVSVGGAEKDSFSISQYHGLYFSLAISLFVLISITKAGRDIGLPHVRSPLFSGAFLLSNSLFLAILIPMLNVNYQSFSIPNLPARVLGALSPTPPKSQGDQQRLDDLLVNQERSSVISMPEDISMELVMRGFYNLRYYPVGLSDSDLVIAPILSSRNSQDLIGGLPSWFQKELDSEKTGTCVSNYLLDKNFTFLTKVEHNSKFYVVYKRN